MKAGPHILASYKRELYWAKQCEEAAETCEQHAEAHRKHAQEHRDAAARWAKGTDLELETT
jgi:hypothetical protein